MTIKSDIRAEADRLRAAFEAKGAVPVETDILQPAGALLDLYGEDIRARAFVTQDPLRGEMMLRPDFTVPLVSRHMDEGRGPARYTYAGEVFRQQEDDPERASEYLQVGFEVFNGADAEAADAEVFATIAEMLAPLGLKAAMGDIGLLRAAVAGLATSVARKQALLHHLWRPRRFKALIDRYSRAGAVSSEKLALLAAPDPIPEDAVEVGLRSRDEVLARIADLRAESEATPVAAEDVARIDALLDIRGTAVEALAQVRSLAGEMPSIGAAVGRMARRLDALGALGVALDTVRFEASYGRTSLEYYDGFVFGFYAEGQDDLPAVATGGRYDALTRAIGGGEGVPAVGGVIRPGLTLALREGS